MIILVVDEPSSDSVLNAVNIAGEMSDLSHLEVLNIGFFGDDGIYLDSKDEAMDGLTIDEIVDKGKVVAVLGDLELHEWIMEYTADVFVGEDAATIAQWLVDTLPAVNDGSDDDETKTMGGSDA